MCFLKKLGWDKGVKWPALVLSDAGEELRCVYKLLKGNESGGGGDGSVHSFPAEQTRESQFGYLAPALTTWVWSHSNTVLSKRGPASKVKVGHGRGRHQTLNFGFHCTHTLMHGDDSSRFPIRERL